IWKEEEEKQSHIIAVIIFQPGSIKKVFENKKWTNVFLGAFLFQNYKKNINYIIVIHVIKKGGGNFLNCVSKVVLAAITAVKHDLQHMSGFLSHINQNQLALYGDENILFLFHNLRDIFNINPWELHGVLIMLELLPLDGEATYWHILTPQEDENGALLSIYFLYVDKCGIVKERFVGLVHVSETTSAHLKTSIDALFAEGQGYDGASNMRGDSAYYLVLVAIVRKHKGVSDFFTKVSILLNSIVDMFSTIMKDWKIRDQASNLRENHKYLIVSMILLIG
ncbi:hypothetical protein ACJX0J_025695, partial [Zea mays]